MKVGLEKIILRLAARRRPLAPPPPLLIELLPGANQRQGWGSESYPFCYRVNSRRDVPYYEVGCTLPVDAIMELRTVVAQASSGLDPREVEPLTFGRLIEVLSQLAAEGISSSRMGSRAKELSELAAYEAVGLSRVLAFAKDPNITEYFVDSEFAPIYLDHASAGRCETTIFLTGRERDSLRTHLDTFSGYTLDFKTPSMKNDLVIAGATLRISLDLEPVSVNRFALDVRRLSMTTLPLPRLVELGVLSLEAAGVLVGWLEAGGNLTIVGETGTGKTTLLNALDEQVERRLRRLYIEDAVETKDLLDRGFHQMKVKVDPFERGEETGRTKESEIVKALHRSPDIVILSEIQSEEHSRAFFQALASGARGIQTFHASSVEQAIRRWVSMHHISEQSLIDLGLMVQMARPDRLKQGRHVQRVSQVIEERGAPRVKEIFARDRGSRLLNVAGTGWPLPPEGVEGETLNRKVELAMGRIAAEGDLKDEDRFLRPL